jgi:hypothetical protein
MDPLQGPGMMAMARPGAFNYSPQSTAQCQIQPSEGGDRKADRDLHPRSPTLISFTSIEAISEQVSH